jgi:molecular chaperone GrpE
MSDQNPDVDEVVSSEIPPVDELAEDAAKTFETESSLESELAEYKDLLQRKVAEFDNYRRRVERDRSVARDNAIAEVVSALFPVLDDFARAREYGELTGAFKTVSESIENTLKKFGLETFGALGEDFDPMLHEGISHAAFEGEGPTKTVITGVMQVGYKIDTRVLRPARVAVADIQSE